MRMILLSEATAIALHAMIYVANRPDRVVSLSEIAAVFKVSPNHLSKILQRLTKCGYLTSIKGPKGGFKIVAKAANITFMKVYLAIEGKPTQRECLFSSKCTQCPNCIMSGLVRKLNKDFYEYLTTKKISDFKL